jgi:hypothetical protein
LSHFSIYSFFVFISSSYLFAISWNYFLLRSPCSPTFERLRLSFYRLPWLMLARFAMRGGDDGRLLLEADRRRLPSFSSFVDFNSSCRSRSIMVTFFSFCSCFFTVLSISAMVRWHTTSSKSSSASLSCPFSPRLKPCSEDRSLLISSDF